MQSRLKIVQTGSAAQFNEQKRIARPTVYREIGKQSVSLWELLTQFFHQELRLGRYLLMGIIMADDGKHLFRSSQSQMSQQEDDVVTVV